MSNYIADPDSVHRLVKLALDSGVAASLDEARRIFDAYRVTFEIDSDVTDSYTHQAALLSGVALASRVFLGGVEVIGAGAARNLVPVAAAATLAAAVREVGGVPVTKATGKFPLLIIGGPARAPDTAFSARLAFAGWSGGIVPPQVEMDVQSERGAMPLAVLLAAALAVNEAFVHLRGESAMAGRRRAGFSLWRPDVPGDWLASGGTEPALELLPSHLWMLGLGHLGQAFLWALGLLPYRESGDVRLILQDIDGITESTPSTSILSSAGDIGRLKTRVTAEWCERRGFKTSLYERFFDSHFRRQEQEPVVALCGFDNADARRALDKAGFDYVVEAGLGSGYRDFRAMRLHTLPGTRTAAELWPASVLAKHQSVPAAYQDLVRLGVLDRCGATLLAGKSVGAPFVGAVAACLAIADILRRLHGGSEFEVADLDLLDLEYRSFVTRKSPSIVLNPGYVRA